MEQHMLFFTIPQLVPQVVCKLVLGKNESRLTITHYTLHFVMALPITYCNPENNLQDLTEIDRT